MPSVSVTRQRPPVDVAAGAVSGFEFDRCHKLSSESGEMGKYLHTKSPTYFIALTTLK